MSSKRTRKTFKNKYKNSKRYKTHVKQNTCKTTQNSLLKDVIQKVNDLQNNKLTKTIQINKITNQSKAWKMGNAQR